MKKIWFISLTFCFLVVFTHHNSQAVEGNAEPSDPDSVDQVEAEAEASAFSNPAQAAHAANLAAEVAAAPNSSVDDADSNVKTAETNLETAKDIQDEAKNALSVAKTNLEAAKGVRDELEAAKADLTATEEDIAGLQQAFDDAEETLDGAIADLEGAKTDLAEAQIDLEETVEKLAGVALGTIGPMRKNGMGWGQIAHTLGVHPSALGLGHTKMKGKNFKNGPAGDLEEDPGDLPAPEVEVAEATKRDIQHGWAKNHGLDTSGASSSKKGLGLSETDLEIGSKSSGSSSKGSSKSDCGSVGGPSNDKSSTGNSKSDRGKTGGPSNDKDKSGNNGNDKDKGGEKGNKDGNNGKK